MDFFSTQKQNEFSGTEFHFNDVSFMLYNDRDFLCVSQTLRKWKNSKSYDVYNSKNENN